MEARRLKTGAKGARFERDLLRFLDYKGFAVMRAPSSGGELSPLDVVAIKRGLVLAIEAKNYAAKPRLDADKVRRMQDWCTRAGAIGILAWKKPRKVEPFPEQSTWLFLPFTDAAAGSYADENWVPMELFLKAFDA